VVRRGRSREQPFVEERRAPDILSSPWGGIMGVHRRFRARPLGGQSEGPMAFLETPWGCCTRSRMSLCAPGMCNWGAQGGE
jgi:hypothetical protein